MDQQTPVVFANRNGLRLFGMLHVPGTGSVRDTGILLLSPGVKMRVGPQCLYRRMTDLFVRLGFPVLRFDFHGIGDSEGELQEDVLIDFYNHIEVGRYVDDALDAVQWMQQHCGVSRVIASGLCGGAVTGLLAGARDDRIVGLLGVGITPVLASRAADASLYMTAGQIEANRKRYLKKSVLSVRSWVRFLTLRSDYRLMWKALVKPLLLGSAHRGSVGNDGPAEKSQQDNANPLFPPAFFEMLDSGRPVLLVFSGADRLYWEFQEKFVARYASRLEAVQSGYDLHVVPNANHVLSLHEWQDDMLDASARWLQSHFGDRTAHQPARAAG